MPLKLNQRAKRIAYTAVLAAFLTAGLTACEQDWQEKEVNVGLYYSPNGAVAPDGLDEITGDSTQDEVIQILGSRYQHFPVQGVDHLGPITDGFLYKEGEASKYIEVWYSGRPSMGRTVSFIRYGYDEFKGIE